MLRTSLYKRAGLLPAFLAIVGCDLDSGAPLDHGVQGEGPFGASRQTALLSPLAGVWAFDLEKTLAAQKAAGVSEEQIAQMRKLYAEHPEFDVMHPDMTINGDEAVCAGLPSAEYRFFAMHEHDGKLCGKAWHHEDRHDPGDMSKCYVRLQLKDGDLYMEQRMKDGWPDLTDPELHSLPAAESGSAAECHADSPPSEGWSEWNMQVFVRKQ